MPTVLCWRVNDLVQDRSESAFYSTIDHFYCTKKSSESSFRYTTKDLPLSRLGLAGFTWVFFYESVDNSVSGQANTGLKWFGEPFLSYRETCPHLGLS